MRRTGNYNFVHQRQEVIENSKAGNSSVTSAHRLTHGQSCHACNFNAKRQPQAEKLKFVGTSLVSGCKITEKNQIRCGENAQVDTRQLLPKYHITTACDVGDSKSQNLSYSSTSFQCGCRSTPATFSKQMTWQPMSASRAMETSVRVPSFRRKPGAFRNALLHGRHGGEQTLISTSSWPVT